MGRELQLSAVEHALARVTMAMIGGLPGTGKSMLAFAVAERWRQPVMYHRIAPGQSLQGLLDDLRQARSAESTAEPGSGLGPGPGLESGAGPGDDDEQLSELADRLDDARALLVLDDLHHLAAAAQHQLVHGLGRQLRHGRVLITTRELPRLTTEIDRLELRLHGLDEGSARVLWSALDELYGPVAGFERAWQRTRGNPLLLRQAHAGTGAAALYGEALAGLTPEERGIVGLLVLARIPLPTAWLAQRLPHELVQEVVRKLGARLIAEVLPDGSCALHPLFRDELSRGVADSEHKALHAELAALIETADLDVVTRAREVCFHLGESDRFEAAGAFLVEQGGALIRAGAARELRHHLEAIPKSRRAPAVQVLHARVLAHVHELDEACQVLSRLVDAGDEPRVDVLLALGPIAMRAGQMAAAEGALTEALTQHALARGSRTRAQVAYGVLRTHHGHGADARAYLRRAAADLEAGEAQRVVLAAEAYSSWLDEQDAEAIEPLRRAAGALQNTADARGASFVAAVLACGLARLGRLAEADHWLATLAALAAQHTDGWPRLRERAVRAVVVYERGDRASAMEHLLDVAQDAERAGDVQLSLWSQIFVARLLLVMGRRRQAMALLGVLAARAEALGIHSATRAVARSRQLDALVQLRAPSLPSEPPSKLGAVVRQRCITALRAAGDGDARVVTELLAANAPLATGEAYAFDRALGHLARAVLARAAGESKLASAALEDARREAREGNVDAEVVEELDAELGRLRVVTGGHTLLRASYADVAASADLVLLDGRSHELRLGDSVRPLGRQAMLRGILYALSGRPGRVVSKQEVATRLWGGQYDPMVHDNRLWANVRRLRLLLANSPLNIEFAEDGYRLAATKRFVYIEPLD